ncbi:MAG: redoxin domain-containing protein [Acidobacteria bacterium]|nr:redoxin domain-containing protein [Acidobacteriota bacterium]
MRRLLIAAGVMCLSAIGIAAQTPTPTPAKPAPTPVPYDKLKVGDMAPDFTLPDTAGNKVKLSDFRGKSNVVLAFYVLAFTGG